MPLQFTITTLIADRLAGVSQFFHCCPFLLGEGGTRFQWPPECPSMASTMSRLKFGGLGVYCYRVTYVLPLCVTMLCIAIAFCFWVHENAHTGFLCWARQPIAMAVRTSTLCRQLVAKLSGITEWYKSGTTRSQNPYAAGFTDQKLYVIQIDVNGIMIGYCVLLKFQFACKSRLWNAANSTTYRTKTHHFGMKISKNFWDTPSPHPTPSAPRFLRLRRSAFPHLFFYKLTTAHTTRHFYHHQLSSWFRW